MFGRSIENAVHHPDKYGESFVVVDHHDRRLRGERRVVDGVASEFWNFQNFGKTNNSCVFASSGSFRRGPILSLTRTSNANLRRPQFWIDHWSGYGRRLQYLSINLNFIVPVYQGDIAILISFEMIEPIFNVQVRIYESTGYFGEIRVSFENILLVRVDFWMRNMENQAKWHKYSHDFIGFIESIQCNSWILPVTHKLKTENGSDFTRFWYVLSLL